jgi:serine-type D-Ala-D-Ala endopeptidase (penicillin-binding protein 7)
MREFMKSTAVALLLLLMVGVASSSAWAAGNKNSRDGKKAATTKSSAAQKKAPPQRVRATVVPAKSRVSGRGVASRKVKRVVEPLRLSYGQVFGLHQTADELDLKSSVALVVDQDTNEVLFSKNPQAVLPIASLTKLMTAVVVADANLPMDELITVTLDDVDTEKGSRSRLKVGTELTRGEMLHLALMSSENRAAHALGRTYPGGLSAFVVAMNRKARELELSDTRYVEPTGLSSRNQSSASDLAKLVAAAHQYPMIRDLSTSPEYWVEVDHQTQHFKNTNGLLGSAMWDIGLQKTGYIAEAGRCLVMQAKLAGRKLIMVFLDSAGRYSRISDAERVRKWLEDSNPQTHSSALPLH